MEYLSQIVRYYRRLCCKYGVMAIIAGADGPTDIHEWAEQHEDDLVKLMKLEFGIPSRDAIRRTLQAIRPVSFQQCFLGRIDSFRETNTTEKELVAVDGKSLRRSHDAKNDLGALHIVSAFSREQGISLGQIACEEKSNEITAIPELPDSIELEDAVVAIDAMGTRKKIVDKIVAKKACCVLAVKDNHKKSHKAIRELFATTDLSCGKVSRRIEEETSHGREEHREYYRTTVPDDFSQQEGWAGLKTIGMAVRTHKDQRGKSKTETRYFISSESRNGKKFAGYVRGHWSIELQRFPALHWVMDVAYFRNTARR